VSELGESIILLGKKYYKLQAVKKVVAMSQEILCSKKAFAISDTLLNNFQSLGKMWCK